MATRDPYFGYVTLLINGNGVDSSDNDYVEHKVSSGYLYPNSNTWRTAKGSFSPAPPKMGNVYDPILNGGSVYAYSTTGSFKLTDGTITQFGTGDFTTEAWIYPLDMGAEISVLGSGGTGSFRGPARFYGAEQYGWVWEGYAWRTLSGVGVIPRLNKWSHVAVSRASGVARTFIDGKLVASEANTDNIVAGSDVGVLINAGYFSNIRVMKGRALYTSDFNPSYYSYGDSTSTSFVLNFNTAAIIDQSCKNAIETCGVVNKSEGYDFNNSSILFNGKAFNNTAEYITTTYTSDFDWWTGDFVIDCWIKPNELVNWNNTGGNNPLLVGNKSVTNGDNYWSFGLKLDKTVCFYYFNGSSNNVASTEKINLGQWNHIAMTKTSGGITIFVNGVASSTTAISGTPQSNTSVPLTIGAGHDGTTLLGISGSIANLRIIKGTAVYGTSSFTPSKVTPSVDPNTKLLLVGKDDGTIADVSSNNRTLTLSPTSWPTVPKVVKKYNSGSLYFGIGSYLRLPGPIGQFAFGTQDFTVEAWVYLTSRTLNTGDGSQILFEARNTAGDTTNWSLHLDTNASGTGTNTLRLFSANGNARIADTTAFPLNTWKHVVFERYSGTSKLYIDGTQVGSSWADTTSYDSTNLYIGSYFGNGGHFHGYMDDIRITKQYARYRGNFTPPTNALPIIGQYGDEVVTNFIDENGKDIGGRYATKSALIDLYPDLAGNISAQGLALTWGNASLGALGDGTTVSKTSPTSLAGSPTGWKTISAGSYQGLGIKTDGTLWGWGRNYNGALGDGTAISKTSPVQVAGGGNNWKSVYCFSLTTSSFTAAIKTDGTLWTWGGNLYGRLGDGTTTARSSPGTVAGGGNNWHQISAPGGGPVYMMAIKTDGTLWGWGRNNSGQLGDGSTIDKSSPGTVAGGGTDWKQVSVGFESSAAIKTDGTLWTWGRNYNGQLGDGTTTNRSSPGTVAGGGNNWKFVSAGSNIVAAIKTDGTLWTWGTSSLGQLGDGATSSKSSPATVAGGGTNWKFVSAGDGHVAAIKTDGTLWCWGRGAAYLLQDGAATNRSSPVSSTPFKNKWISVSAGEVNTYGIVDIN